MQPAPNPAVPLPAKRAVRTDRYASKLLPTPLFGSVPHVRVSAGKRGSFIVLPATPVENPLQPIGSEDADGSADNGAAHAPRAEELDSEDHPVAIHDRADAGIPIGIRLHGFLMGGGL